MAVDSISRRLVALLFLFFSQAIFALAQPTSANPPANGAATTSYLPYSQTANAAGGTYAGDTTFVNSSPTDAAGENAAGASGGQGGSVNLSMGSVIAIVVVVAVVVLFGAATAVLFFIAKKRQWQVRKSIRRTATRVTSRVMHPKTPRTPREKPMTFPSTSEVSDMSSRGRPSASPPRRDTKVPLKIDTSSQSLSRSGTPSISTLPPALAAKKHQKSQSQQIRSRSVERRMDLEKKPRGIVASQFDMESPIKGTIWTKMFGKK